MFNVVEKMKVFNWLRWKHHQKNVTPAKANSGSSSKQFLRSGDPSDSSHGQEGIDQQKSASSQGCIHYRHKGWISQLNPLHFEKRSCGHNRDVHPYDQNTRSQGSESVSQAMEEEDKLKNNSEATLILSHKHLNSTAGKSHKVETIKLKQVHAASDQIPSTFVMKLEGDVAKTTAVMLVKNDKAQARTVETPKEQSGPAIVTSQLKNRVLPLLEDSLVLHVNNTQVEKLEKVRSVRIFDPIPELPCEGGYGRGLVGAHSGGISMETAKETLRRSGSVSFKKTTTLIKSPESPKSPRDTKWWKLLSHSRGSPKCHSCHIPEWNVSQDMDKAVNNNPLLQISGTMSTMGSPWNSGAGSAHRFAHGVHSQHCFCHRRSSCRQGQWITTDSEYVVLEL